MDKKLIFVSCGQGSADEIRLGLAIGEVINTTPGFEAFFADQVKSLEALTGPIFRALKECSGMVAVLQGRGTVMLPDGKPWGIRSSVWVNQEIAILAYRFATQGQNIPILPFKEKAVQLEGAVRWLITNPDELVTVEAVVAKVKQWLGATTFPTTQRAAKTIFRHKWNTLSSDTRLVLAVLVEEGGVAVKQQVVKDALRQRHGIPQGNRASEMVRQACLEFVSTDLVKIIRDIQTGDELTINPTWRDAVVQTAEEGRFECHLATRNTPQIDWQGGKANIRVQLPLALLNKSPHSVIASKIYVDFEWNDAKNRQEPVKIDPPLPISIPGGNGSARLETVAAFNTPWRREQLPSTLVRIRYYVQTGDGAAIRAEGDALEVRLD